MKAILLDRDNTLNEDPGYINDPGLVVLKPGVLEGMSKLKQAGYQFFVMTNQSGVARGRITTVQLEAVHARLSALLAGAGVRIEKFYVCPHGDPIVCECRKPMPGLFMQFFREYQCRPDDCFAVGDKIRDIAAAEPAGVQGIWIDSSTEALESLEVPKNLVHRAGDFQDAVNYILSKERG